MEGISTSPKAGASIKLKQFRLYEMCYDYLIDNFHKFTDANKLKVSLSLATKMAPSEVEGGIGAHSDTKIIIIRPDSKNTKESSEAEISIIRPSVANAIGDNGN